MRTITATALYWLLLALGAMVAVVTGAELAIGDHHPVPEYALAGLLPRSVLLVVVAAVALVLAGTTATAAAAARSAAPRAAAVPAVLMVGAVSTAVLVVLTMSADLLALAGYLPFALVMAVFDEGWRADLLNVLNHSLLLQLMILVGVFLWGAAARQYLHSRPRALPGWTRPEAASRWGRAATVVAVIPPLVYAATRFAWIVYPLGFDRAQWEAARATGHLWSGVWLGVFAALGAVLTLGLVQRWGEVVPRWVPGLAGRPVPVALAVVPASLVALIILPAGISMIRQFGGGAAIDFIDGWAAFGPMFLWPLWSVALGVATLGYALRRRGKDAAEVPTRGGV
ncbi:hypothetical protein [Pseudactinotalea sp. Z1748]|uniref:hypothetical protein n=1 Tax=Pseudactinotalea sp. Z1748 TaxID=3413027 RepID=UPI003C7CAD6F